MPKLKGEIPLTFSDGREVTLRVDMDAMIEAEEAAGVRFQEILRQISTKDGPPLRTQRALFYGMLKQDMPELTVSEAGNLLLREAAAFEKGMKAMGDSMPEGDAAEGSEVAGDGDEDPTTTKAAEAPST